MSKQFIFLLILLLSKNISAQSHIEKVHEKLKQQYDIVSCFDSLGTAKVAQRAKFGFVDTKGKIIAPFIYQKGNPFAEGKAAAKRDGKWGFVDSTGKEICAFVYDSATHFQQGFGIVVKGEQLYWLNDKGKRVDSLTEGENFTAWTKYNTWFETKFPQPWRFFMAEAGKVGVKEIGSERVIFPPIYDFIDLFKGKTHIFKLEVAGRHYLGNANTGNMIPYLAAFTFENKEEKSEEESWEEIPWEWENLEEEAEYVSINPSPFMCVQNEAREWAVLDTNFQEILPFSPENQKLDFLTENYFWVTSPEIIGRETVEKKATASLNERGEQDEDGKRFGINSASCAAVEAKKEVQNAEKQQTFAIISNKMGIKNVKGEWIVPPRYNLNSAAKGDFCLAYREGNWYLLNFKTGGEKFYFSPNEYKNSGSLLENGLLLIQNKRGFWGVKDTNGNDFLAFEYDKITYNEDWNNFILQKKGKWGMIDANKKEILPFEYLKIQKTKFHEYICLVTEQGKMGFANQKGEIIIAPIYNFDRSFTDLDSFYFDKEVAVIQKKQKWGAINAKGEEIIPFRYDSYKVLSGFPHYLFSLEENKTQIIQNLQGKKIDIGTEFSYENSFNSLQQNPKSNKYDAHLLQTTTGFGLINTKGEILLPFHYSNPFAISKQGFMGVYDFESAKMGLADTNGKLILPLKYANIGRGQFYRPLREKERIYNEQILNTSLPEGYFKVQQNGKVGLVRANGQEVFPCLYNEIVYKSANEWWVMQNHKWGLLNEKGKILLPLIYERVAQYGVNEWGEKEFFPISNYYLLIKEGKQMLINGKNKPVLPTEMSEIEFAQKYIFAKETQDAPYKMYDSLGHFQRNLKVSKIRWDLPRNLPFLLVPADTQSQFQILTLKGELFPEKYEQIIQESEGYLVSQNGKTGYLSKNGEPLISPIYDYLSRLEALNRETFFEASKDKKYGVLDAKGKIILPLIYDGFMHYQAGGSFSIAQNGKWGRIDTFFRQTLPFKYNNPVYGNRFSEKEKIGYLNEKGEEILPPLYDAIDPEGDYLRVKQNELYGLTDKQGKIILDLAYWQMHSVNKKGTICRVLKDKKWGLIDVLENKLILPLEYEQITDFLNGYAVIKKDDKCGVIDSFGKIILPIQYEGIEVVEKGFLLKKDCKYGFANYKGGQILPLEYDMIEEETGHYYEPYYYLTLSKDNLYGIYDFATQKLISPKYPYPPSAFYSGKPQNVLWERMNEEKKKGLMDINEKILIPLEYDNLDFYEPDSQPNKILIQAMKYHKGSDFFTENGGFFSSKMYAKSKCMCDDN